jgi:hypothetical protein
MSPTKLSMAGNYIIPGLESLVSDIPAGVWKNNNLFAAYFASKIKR